MQEKSNILKKIIIAMIVLVIIIGIFLGIKFYNNNTNINKTPDTQVKTGPTPFQTRVGSSSQEVTITKPKDLFQENNTETATTTEKKVDTRLTQLWPSPVSGFDFIYKDVEIFATTSTSTISSTTVATTSTTTRSIDEKKTVPTKTVAKVTIPKNKILKNQEYIYIWDRSTGNIFENLASTSETVRLSNNTMPRIEEAYFTGPTSVFVRGLNSDNENITNKYITLFKDFATSTLYRARESFVYLYSKQTSFLPDNSRLFYFTEKTGTGISNTPDGSNPSKVIKTTLTEWLSQFVNKNTVAITTKPSAYFPGYLFFVNTNGTGNNTYVIGEKYGFTTLVSPNGKKVLYSEIRNNQLETVVYDVTTKKDITLKQSTLSEKCVWAADSLTIYCAIPQKLASDAYPDVWYQGKTSFTDNVWSIDPTTGEFTSIINLQLQVSTPIDAYNLKVSQNKKYLLFQDKYSLSLWKYNL